MNPALVLSIIVVLAVLLIILIAAIPTRRPSWSRMTPEEIRPPKGGTGQSGVRTIDNSKYKALLNASLPAMEPRSTEECCKINHPEAAYGCRWIVVEQYQTRFVPTCIIDCLKRPCQGQCSKFEPKEKVSA
jgi:hypothetical protein